MLKSLINILSDKPYIFIHKYLILLSIISKNILMSHHLTGDVWVLYFKHHLIYEIKEKRKGPIKGVRIN